DLLARIEEVDLDVWARACHSTLGFPAFAAISGNRTGVSRSVWEFVGFGAHYIPEIALSRAITECMQGRITMISGSRDDLYPYMYAGRDVPRPTEMYDIVPADTAFPTTLRDVPRPPPFESFAEVLAWTLAALEREGFTD